MSRIPRGKALAWVCIAAGAAALLDLSTAFVSGSFGAASAGRARTLVPRREAEPGGAEAVPAGRGRPRKPRQSSSQAEVTPVIARGTKVKGTVVRVEKTYCLVDFNDRTGLIPSSHMSSTSIPDARTFLEVGAEVDAWVSEVQSSGALLTMREGEHPEKLPEPLVPGLEVFGRVTELKEWGAYVQLDGRRGQSRLLEGKEADGEKLKVGDVVQCWVKSNLFGRTFTLTRDQTNLTDLRPFQGVLSTQEKLEGTVVETKKRNACIVELVLPGGERGRGYLPQEELGDLKEKDGEDTQRLAVGDKVKVRIDRLDLRRSRMSLSARDAVDLNLFIDASDQKARLDATIVTKWKSTNGKTGAIVQVTSPDGHRAQGLLVTETGEEKAALDGMADGETVKVQVAVVPDSSGVQGRRSLICRLSPTEA